jgi:Fe2+ transport system protein FeoA
MPETTAVSARVLTLPEAPVQTPLVIASAPADPAAAHRLSTLGWRPGAPTAVLRRSSGGARVVTLGGARVAIGGPLARDLAVSVAG